MMEKHTFNHQTVLLDEAVSLLVTDKGGAYVDGTYGRGGHSKKILQQLEASAQLLLIDKDPLAILSAQQLAAEDSRVSVWHGAFSRIDDALTHSNFKQVDGILLDIGVSSPQLDDPERGFSFMANGQLDMRMDTTQGETASQWLSSAPEAEIKKIIREYGEERHANIIARRIVAAREQKAILHTHTLADIVSQAIPRRFHPRNKHPATRTFQAIRIFINDELGELEKALSIALRQLKLGGRLVVISFHSLEDRMVKQYFRTQSQAKQMPRGLPVMGSGASMPYKLIGKAVRASEAEVSSNPRSRSAIMRTLERVA